MRLSTKSARARLLIGASVAVLAMSSGAALAQERELITIAPQSLTTALQEFGSQTSRQVMFSPGLIASKKSAGVSAAADEQIALAQLLQGTGLSFRREGDIYLIVGADDPQGASAVGDGADGTVEALIVTAQKREEDIQDVPIAISAFTQEALERSQVAGGPDLMTQVPNMTFTKTNFSSYSIQIRGIGTQAISATTDPAVAVAFNNTPFVRNRFFEQEFYDLQRVEVLRGPQGTLYGRNATAGVVNIISQKPKFAYDAKVSADVANYNSTRLEGMVNVPLVDDRVALRLAGAWTKREGYSTNEITGNPIDGRDLWSTRASLRLTPNDRLDVNLIWEHFEEDDDRIRSGKQLCNTHVVSEVAGFTQSGGFTPGSGFPLTGNSALPNTGQGGVGPDGGFSGAQAVWSQGCTPASLYAPESFQVPNGYSLPYYIPLGAVFLPTALPNPYVSAVQSPDLRVIESTVDPEYRAKSDVVELQVSFDLTDSLTLNSETAWASDFIFSTQDFNRFNTASGAWATHHSNGGSNGLLERGILQPGPNGFAEFCDPQIGCADRLVAVDLSTATSSHFSQEFRLGSNFEGPFNFSLGANYLRYDTEDKYYVFINSLSMIAAISPFGGGFSLPRYEMGVTDNSTCLTYGIQPPNYSTGEPILQCTYIDPNPIDSLNDQGHNYFLSRNPYKLISYAVFGESYYNVTDALKITAGLRWTVDKKQAPRIPSWLLASNTVGSVPIEVINLEWRKPTGRVAIDWKPDLAFTDETLLYASYARGYKAGGANPPPYGVAIYTTGVVQNIIEQSATNPKTFDPEYVDAFELGAKNTLLDGRLTLNLAGFYYDYKGYQISQIVDRSATNLNFDAEVWGLELEADWRPLENLRLGLKLGYEDTKVADGERAIDIMDRTAGTPGWIVVRPFPSIPSNCVLPEWLFVGTLGEDRLVNLGGAAGGNPAGCELAYGFNLDPVTRAPYVPNPTVGGTTMGSSLSLFYETSGPNRYPGFNPLDESVFQHNHGQGFFKDLSGNELPNAPHYTATLTADYTIPLPNDWLATLHTDLYYQSEAWTRIFNMEGYDKLKAYTNVNLAAIFTNEDAGWKVMAYVKNVFDRDSITGAFLNSDDTGLTTNVFLTEPRLYGLRVTKEWNGGPWWTGANPDHKGPFPLTIEFGGQVQRHDAVNEPVEPGFSSLFREEIDIFGQGQNEDLDWGDGREVKLTWRPSSGPWTVSGAMRYGRTNKTGPQLHREDQSAAACGFGGKYAFLCPIYEQYYGFDPYISQTDWADTSAKQREEHEIVEFAVGRDVGLGGLSRSMASVGLRHATFDSTTSAEFNGVPNWFIPPGWAFPPPGAVATYTRFTAERAIERSFEGAGPVLEWDASLPLLGDDETGHLTLDWSLSGGLLFGKQDMEMGGYDRTALYQRRGFAQVPSSTWTPPISTPVVTPVNAPPRSEDVTVPVAGVELGLSYGFHRIRLGAGYRWERYHDVLDVGVSEARQADRTIDGPYFKLAVGFGG